MHACTYVHTYLGCRLRVDNHEESDEEEEHDDGERLGGCHGCSSMVPETKYASRPSEQLHIYTDEMEQLTG